MKITLKIIAFRFVVVYNILVYRKELLYGLLIFAHGNGIIGSLKCYRVSF